MQAQAEQAEWCRGPELWARQAGGSVIGSELVPTSVYNADAAHASLAYGIAGCGPGAGFCYCCHKVLDLSLWSNVSR